MKSSKHIELLKNKVDAAHTIARVKKDEASARLYARLKKLLKESIVQSIKEKNAEKINRGANKIQAMWRIINQESRKKGDISPSSEETDLTADCFGSHFIAAAHSQARPSPRASLDLLNNSKLHVSESLYVFPVTEDEILKLAANLKNKDSKYIYGMSTSLLKKIVPYIEEPLSRVFNDCIDQGIFPSELKLALITPVFKKGDIRMCSSYRPISVLPTI